MSNFWRSLDLPLINGEMLLDLIWTKNCVISEISRTAAMAENPDLKPHIPAVAAAATTSAMFQINNAKLYVPVFTLSINDNINFSENIKQRFKRTISWKKISNKNSTKKQ